MTAIMSLQFHDSLSVAETSDHPTDRKSDSDPSDTQTNLSREEMDQRLRLVIERSVEAISFRGKLLCSSGHASCLTRRHRRWLLLQ